MLCYEILIMILVIAVGINLYICDCGVGKDACRDCRNPK